LRILLFLILFPLVSALILSLVRQDFVRRLIVIISASALIIASLGLLWVCDVNKVLLYELGGAWVIPFTGWVMPFADWIRPFMKLIELCIAAYILVVSIRHRKWLIVPLILTQAGIGLWFEITHAHDLGKGAPLFVDSLSLIMALIIGIVGSLIAVYALGYMRDFHSHAKAVPDKRRSFFFITFVFLSAMFGVVFSNDLLWFYFFWEITTISSFVMIGYRGNRESIDNAFLALGLNLLGGLAMCLGIVILALQTGAFEWSQLLSQDKLLVMAPIILLSVGGIVKAAQLPFSSWLLGAMVAPTPVSALLHSSTMVKAGVYLLVKLGPLLADTYAGLLISLLGGFTFLMTSIIAISQSDAKRVLAYSTIANLGLIVMCAGIGTYASIWTAVLLVIFHAVAKGLLFLCVGEIEHTIGNRNIESMEGLVVAMPRFAWLMLIGMAGMFLAPFGMLISKWAALVAVIESHPILSFLLIYGSAATLFFWAKWMGKILSVNQHRENIETGIDKTVWAPLDILAFMLAGVCLSFPYLSHEMIEPYVRSVYGVAATMSAGNLITMLIMMGLIFLFFISRKGVNFRNTRRVEPYMGGANIPDTGNFSGSAGAVHGISFRNYYLEKYCGERLLFYPSVLISLGLLMVLMIGTVV